MYNDKSIELKKGDFDEGPYLTSNRSCSELYDKFGPLSFMIGMIKFTIHPEGYLFENSDANLCFIGIQGIDDKINEYRLGQTFLKNFYVGLDYESNSIQIGLNANATTAEMVQLKRMPDYGRSKGNQASPTPKKKQNKTELIVIFVFVFVIVLAAIVWFIRQRKQKISRTQSQTMPNDVVVAEQVTDLDKMGPDGLDVSAEELDNTEKLL